MDRAGRPYETRAASTASPYRPLPMAVLEHMAKIRESEIVFPGNQRAVLSNHSMLVILKRMGRESLTVHGFRSSFRDWAAERTNFPNEMLEMALARTRSATRSRPPIGVAICSTSAGR